MSDITNNRFSDFDPNFILDTFLRCLTINVDNKMSISDFIVRVDIFNNIVYYKKIIITDGEFESIISKLIRDCNIIQRTREDKLTEYSLTFEGFVFLLNGGYSEAYSQAKADKARVLKYESNQDLNLTFQRSIVYLTYWIALGTVIPSLYYLLQIYDGKTIERPYTACIIFGISSTLGIWKYINLRTK